MNFTLTAEQKETTRVIRDIKQEVCSSLALAETGGSLVIVKTGLKASKMVPAAQTGVSSIPWLTV